MSARKTDFMISTVDGNVIPAYPFDGADLQVILKHLRWLGIVAPIVLVLLLELVRIATIGAVSLQSRLLLDGLVVAAFVLISIFTVRAIGKMQSRLERHNEELLALHGAGLDVSAELSLDAVLNKVVERARMLVGARYGALSVVNNDGSIQTFLTSGITPEQRARVGAPPVGHGLLGVVLREGKRLRLPDIGKDPRSYGFPPNHPAMHSLLAVPITCKSPFVGNLYLSEKQGRAEFTASDEATLERFAVQAGIAIDNAHLHRQVADLAVAQERLHIAHEMHDGIAQVLAYVSTKVQAATEYIRRGDSEAGTAQLRELAAAAREAYGDVRESIVDLRTLPGPTSSFEEVLREYVDRWKEQTGISTQLVVEGDLVLPMGTELQLVRIIQESLTNVRKHSRAATARVDIRRLSGKLLLSVSDDGVGFTPGGARSRGIFPRFGLTTMRERAESIGASFSIESTPGSGTTVRVEIPLTAN
jgi:signal transduction histidine kinase